MRSTGRWNLIRWSSLTDLTMSLPCLRALLGAHYMGGSIWVFSQLSSFFFSYLRDLKVTKTGTGPFIEWLYREKRCEMQYLMLTAAFANWSNWICAFCLAIAIQAKSEFFFLNVGCHCFTYLTTDESKKSNHAWLFCWIWILSEIPFRNLFWLVWTALIQNV